jgi:hypothetical protein
MKLTIRDLFATVVVAAVGVPYIGYLVNGEMPFVKDPRGMSAIGLLLGAVAFLILRGADKPGRVGRVKWSVWILSLVLGVVAFVFAEAAASETLLALFMGSILLAWSVEMTDHSGLLSSKHGAGLTHA